VGSRTDLDKLTIEVQSDGTITPSEALVQAATVLIDHFHIFTELQPTARREKQALTTVSVPSRISEMPIEALDLSARTYNCLKRSQITKVGQILQMSEDELLSLRNFGQKSLQELREKLSEHGIPLGESAMGEGTGAAVEDEEDLTFEGEEEEES
jgi:DNA-directed RNA polymerase subunit alpha